MIAYLRDLLGIQTVTAFFLVSEEGSDPPIMDVLGIKASEAHRIVDPHLGVQKAEDDMSNLRRLVDRYLTRGKAAKQDAIEESANTEYEVAA